MWVHQTQSRALKLLSCFFHSARRGQYVLRPLESSDRPASFAPNESSDITEKAAYDTRPIIDLGRCDAFHHVGRDAAH